MNKNTGLTWWLFRSLWPVTLIGWLITIPTVLLYSNPLGRGFMLLELFILIHSLVIVSILGRYRSGQFAFLYERGFSRDVLWLHTMFASMLGALAVWLPMAVIVWAPLRASLQDKLLNPLFPFMASTEHFAPWLWLGMYVALLSVFHWVWIRGAQPERGGYASWIVAVGAVVAIVGSREAASRAIRSGHGIELSTMMIALTVIIALTALIAGWRLHRRVEVQA